MPDVVVAADELRLFFVQFRDKLEKRLFQNVRRAYFGQASGSREFPGE